MLYFNLSTKLYSLIFPSHQGRYPQNHTYYYYYKGWYVKTHSLFPHNVLDYCCFWAHFVTVGLTCPVSDKRLAFELSTWWLLGRCLLMQASHFSVFTVGFLCLQSGESNSYLNVLLQTRKQIDGDPIIDLEGFFPGLLKKFNNSWCYMRNFVWWCWLLSLR